MAYSLDNCCKEKEGECRTRNKGMESTFRFKEKNIIQNFQPLHLNKPTVIQLLWE